MNIRARLLYTLLLCSSMAMAANLESVVVKEAAGKTTITFIANSPFVHKAFILRAPERVVIDFQLKGITVDVNRIGLGSGLIMRARSGHTSQQMLRLVFDVKEPVSIRTTAWAPPNKRQKGFRIELKRQPGIKKSIITKTNVVKKPAHITTTNVVKTPQHIQYATSRSHRDVIVVLDPGHGGKDPGAAGPMHSSEKTVVLAIALKLKKMIDKQPGMRAVMTRNGDYYVGLRERLNIARRHNADIFVSIHADAFINRHSSGASVFALSPTGATSEAARWLAEKENYSELGGVNLSGLDDQNGLIRTVLLDLSQTATISASLQMGNRVLHRLDKVTSLHNSAVEQARFVVLKSPDIPSVLVETGFITNPREEKNLTSSAYQEKLTQAIYEGIKNYFYDYPPHGSRMEVMSGTNLHIVQSGESLPVIAARYHVSEAAIKIANHLSDVHLRSGQKLSIPTSWA